MTNIKVNGADFYCTLKGSGPPLVIICGSPADHNFCPVFIDEMRKNFTVLTFDNRGIGRTKDDGRELTAELMATDTRLIIEKLGLESPT